MYKKLLTLLDAYKIMESYTALLSVSDWILAFVIIIVCGYIYLTWNFNYFKNIGLKNPKPYPGIGTSYIFFQKNRNNNNLVDFSLKFGKTYGIFTGRNPEFVIGDEDMLKEILGKQFHSFADRKSFHTGEKYMDRMMHNQSGEEWKRMRALTTPAFTTGRLKRMSPDLKQCCKDLVKSMETILSKEKDCDVKKISGNFTIDLISKMVFGINIDTQMNQESEFAKYSKMLKIKIGLATFVHLACPFLSPYLQKIDMGIIPNKCTAFFCGLIDHMISSKEEKHENRNDFLSMVIHSNKLNHNIDSSGKEHIDSFDRIDIVALSYLFFFAGGETLSSGISVCCHHLAINSEWQEKVVEEIHNVIKDDEDFTYENMKKLPLLTMCIEESLRISPPAPMTDRECTADTVLNGIHIKKGTNIIIPIYAIHHDPDYYPEPEKFDPMRFTQEAKAARSNYVYLAFGQGLRDCIAKRLAMLELKMALAYLLRSFELSCAPGEKKDIKMSAFGSIDNAWITIKRRIKD